MLMLLSSRYTIGISPDSVAYISVARHLLDGTGFICYDGYYYVLQAPLYPVLLAAITLTTNVDPLISTGFVNALLYGLIIYFSGVLFAQHLQSKPLALIGATAVMFSFVIVQASIIALSEPLFILFIIISLILFEKYRNTKRISLLIFYSMAVALACLTRYVGIVLIFTGAISIMAFVQNSIKRKVYDIVLLLIISLLPTGLWVVRNIYLTGTLVGQRASSSFSFADNVWYSLRTLVSWFSPGQKSEIEAWTLMITSIIIMAIALGAIKKNTPESASVTAMAQVSLFMLFYVGLIIVSSTTTAYDKIDSRLLSPVFIPLILVIFTLIDKSINWMRYYVPEGILSCIVFLELAFWIQYQSVVSRASIAKYISVAGCEYTERRWMNNTVIKFLNNNPMLAENYIFYSNVPEAVYILADIDAKWSPAKTFYNSPAIISSIPNVRTIHDSAKPICIVWINTVDRQFLFTLEELKQHIPLTRIALLSDGEVLATVAQHR